MKFETKDSGARQEYDSGMRRDTQEGKPRFNLLLPRDVPYEDQMLTRFAELMSRGADKYNPRNWEQACSEEELERAKESLLRHTMQTVCGDTSEDHSAAVMYNVMLLEYIRWRLENGE